MSGRFEILVSLGTDLLALDRRGGSARAVVLSPVPAEVADDPARLARLASEVESCAPLFHANLVAPSALEGFGDGLAVVHPHREGATLREVLDGGGRLPPDIAVRVAADVCAALAHVHARAGADGKPLAHGALAPERVILTPEGIALVTGFCSSAAGGRAPPGDLRALGAMLHECLAGEPPPATPRPLEAPGVPSALAAVVDRALAGDGTASEHGLALADALAPAIADAVAAYVDAIVPPDEGPRGERRAAVARAMPAPVRSAPEKGPGAPAERAAAAPVAEEVSEDAIMGEPTPAVVTPVGGPTAAVADDLIMGEITPDPSGGSVDEPAAAPVPRAAPPPEIAEIDDLQPTPAALPAPSAAPSSADVAQTLPIPAPAAAGSRALLYAALVMLLSGFGVGFALTRAPGLPVDVVISLRPGGSPDSTTTPAAPAEPDEPSVRPERGAADEAARSRGAPTRVAALPALDLDPDPEPAPAPVPARPARAPPPPQKPSIVVTADPVADVYVDGKKIGRAPLTHVVSRGTHDVRLRDGARGIDARRKVNVRGPSTPVRFALGKGTLDVTAPEDAEVYVDGKRVGRGDVKLELYEGDHRIEVRRGEASTGERFRLGPGETWTYEVTPTP